MSRPPLLGQARPFRLAGRLAAATALLVVTAVPAAAQRAPNTANWELTKRFSGDALRPIVSTTTLNARWIADTDSAWYQWRDPAGKRFMLLVPKNRAREPLFDHVKMAADLSALSKKPYEGNDLPFNSVSFDEEGDGTEFTFTVERQEYRFDMSTATLSKVTEEEEEEVEENAFKNFSPDSSMFAFAREHNLFVVDVASGDTTQLTTDGEEDFSFGWRDTTQTRRQQQQDDEDEEEQEDNGRSRDPRVRARVDWSPDGAAFYVSRSDSREVGKLYLVNVLAEPRPELVEYRYAMPGEENVTQYDYFVWKAGETALTELPVDIYKDQRVSDVHWIEDASRLRMQVRDRLQRNLQLVEVDLNTLQRKTLIEESVEDAYLERNNVQYVERGGDMVWWSERTGWGHLYLYSHDGQLKRPLTSGPWRVDGLADIDTINHTIFFRGVGREAGENPYWSHLYRVNADGSGLALLDAGEGDHRTSLSPSFRFAVDSYSQPDVPSVAVLRDARSGQKMMDLEAFDVAPLEEIGWVPPEEFVVKAADGITDLYGNMWKPFDFDPAKKYPIIAYVYPGPQTESVNTSFSPTDSRQQLAQLGFIVIQVGNRGGSPRRSNAYHSYGYYNLRDYGLADKKSGIEQLAARHSFIDIDKVGIYGHSGGGFMTAAALLLPPYNDFFKVGVSSSGNHDNNIYNQNWSEQHHGLKEVRKKVEKDIAAGQDGDVQQEQEEEVSFDIHVPANHELAENLKGKLLLVHGDMDNNVHPGGTIRLANALIKANKRFDLFIMPGKPHGYGDMQDYFQRMLQEYFAEHLLGDYYRVDAEIR